MKGFEKIEMYYTERFLVERVCENVLFSIAADWP